ncbi:MAG: alpha/beta hydrolase [Burkholderiales bacterium]|nr:alpha/beta hydrolase [Bacteroidia bacterium]
MWRLIIAAVLLLLSLLTVFKAPTNFFWRVAVAVTEFPYIPVLVSFAFFVICINAKSYKIPTLIITGVAFVFYSLPIIEACVRGNNLSKELANVFPSKQKENELNQPFSFFKQFAGIGVKEVNPTVLTYKVLPERKLNIDFYSAGKVKAPCVVVIHGGSWSLGDSKQLPALNSYLAGRGYHVAAINYRLAPKYRFPAQIVDTKDVIAYLTQKALELNIDTSNFVLLGRSAGGQIALLSAYTFNDPKIKGVISLYGPADMVWGAKIKSNKLVLDVDKVFSDYLGGLISEVPEIYEESSARNFVTQKSTPTLLIHGFNDVLVSYYHSVRLAETLDKNNVPYYFLNLPWATHGCDYNINGPSGQLSTYSIERFINSVTTH